LRRQLENRGCTVTEFPERTPPLKYHFPRRNRLIAALVQAVVVVEAPRKSGAMLTAYQAVDYDREVFAVPGPVDLETSRGCHHLLREGAHVLESGADLQRVLGPPGGPTTGAPVESVVPARDDPAPGTPASWIFDRLDLEGVSRDELRSRWPGNEQTWVAGLLALELAGLIRRLPGGKLARSIWRP
jgi:DNA processing protein